MSHIPVEQQTRVDSIRQWCDKLVTRAEIFEREGDETALKYLHRSIVDLWLEVDPTYSIGINGPPETAMGSTAMREREDGWDEEVND